MSHDADTVMDDDSEEESKENAAKTHTGGKKNGGPKRDALDGKDKNKGLVSTSKLANKRSQKEAIKKNKMKRNKGTVKDEAAAPQN